MADLHEGQEKDVPSGPIFKSFTGPLLIFLGATYFYFLAGKIDENPMEGQLGPAFWPKMILILLIVSCGVKILEIIKERKGAKGETTIERPSCEADTPKLAMMIAMVVAAVYFMDIIGFSLVNFLFLLLFMRIAGLRKKLPLFLISGLGTIFLLYLFVKVVYLPLPKGQWFFDDLTIILYRILHII